MLVKSILILFLYFKVDGKRNFVECVIFWEYVYILYYIDLMCKYIWMYECIGFIRRMICYMLMFIWLEMCLLKLM